MKFTFEILVSLLFLTVFSAGEFVPDKRPELVIVDNRAVLTTPGPRVYIEPLFMTKGQLHKGGRLPPRYWARAWAFDRIVRRLPSEHMKKKQNFTTNRERLQLRLRYVNATALSTKSSWDMLDEVAGILKSDDNPMGQVVGVIIDRMPSPEILWAQIVYETASSLRLQVIVTDTRGPTFVPPSPTLFDDQRTACAGLFEANTYDPFMGDLLTAMPSQQEIDAGIVEIIFVLIKSYPLAIVIIDEEDNNQGAALISTIEELLHEATQREQVLRIFRLKGHVIDRGENATKNWQQAVKEISNRWRKQLIISYRREFERKFIATALELGLATRGYMYLTLDSDFHLDPLDLSCSVGYHTSVNSIRLRRLVMPIAAENSTSHSESYEIADGDMEFHSVTMKTTIETLTKALSSPPANTSEKITDISKEKQCANYDTSFINRAFNAEKQSWALELLNITNNGYYVRLQYAFPVRKMNWILNPVFSPFPPIDSDIFESWIARRVAEIPGFRITKNGNRVGSRRRQDDASKGPIKPCQYKRKLKLTTILEPPFVMLKRSGEGPPQRNNTPTMKSGMSRPGVIGSRYMISRLEREQHLAAVRSYVGNDALEGYCIDLLERMSGELGFSYELTLVPDNKYGSFINDSWTGMIGELERGAADIAFAPLTVTQQRAKVVDFTQSFMTTGIGLLHYKQVSEDDDLLLGMFGFFRPFHWEVWLGAGASVLFYSFVHLFLCWASPLERSAPSQTDLLDPTKPPPPDVSNPAWTVHNSIWLAVSNILQQGCDYFPAAQSTRFLYVTWGFVSLVLCSCYTANLAAFLTNERLETPLRKATDLLGQNKTRYGTLFGGSTHSFFKNSKIEVFRELHANIIRDDTFVQVQSEGIRRVIAAKGKYAFFLESTKLEYEMARDCRLVQVGPLLDNKAYGIATQKGSPLRDLLSTEILKLQTEGILQNLKNKWWVEHRAPDDNMCPDRSAEASSRSGRRTSKLTSKVLGGAFIILFGGLVLGLIACLVEFVTYGISEAIHANGYLQKAKTLISVWRDHFKRVLAAGVTQVVLRSRMVPDATDN